MNYDISNLNAPSVMTGLMSETQDDPLPAGFNILTGMFGPGLRACPAVGADLRHTQLVAKVRRTKTRADDTFRHLSRHYNYERRGERIIVTMSVVKNLNLVGRVQALLGEGYTIRRSLAMDHFAIYLDDCEVLSTRNPGGVAPTITGVRGSKRMVFSAPAEVFSGWVGVRAGGAGDRLKSASVARVTRTLGSAGACTVQTKAP